MILGGGKYKWVLQRGFVTGKLRIFCNESYLTLTTADAQERQRMALAWCRDDANRGDEQAIIALLMMEKE